MMAGEEFRQRVMRPPADRILAFSAFAADYEFVICVFGGGGLRFPEFIPWTAQCRPPMNPKHGSTDTLFTPHPRGP